MYTFFVSSKKKRKLYSRMIRRVRLEFENVSSLGRWNRRTHRPCRPCTVVWMEEKVELRKSDLTDYQI